MVIKRCYKVENINNTLNGIYITSKILSSLKKAFLLLKGLKSTQSI